MHLDQRHDVSRNVTCGNRSGVTNHQLSYYRSNVVPPTLAYSSVERQLHFKEVIARKESDAAARREHAAARQAVAVARQAAAAAWRGPSVAVSGPAPAKKSTRRGATNKGALGGAPPAAERVATAGVAEAESPTLLTGSELCPDVELGRPLSALAAAGGVMLAAVCPPFFEMVDKFRI